jgi:small subunit ribosomal protein S4
MYKNATRISRRFGTETHLYKPGKVVRGTVPGQDKSKMKRRRETPYGICIKHRTAVKVFYDIKTSSLIRIMKTALQLPGSSEDITVKILELRLQNVVFRSGFAASPRAACQLVAHEKVLVNGKTVDIKSYRLKVGDEVSLDKSALENSHCIAALEASELAQSVPSWIDFDSKKKIAKIIDEPCLANTKYLIDIDFSKLLQNLNR